jgi:hypothetical protein
LALRLKLVLGLLICMQVPLIEAYSDAQAFTNSHLISYGSDFSILRTVSDNSITTADLDFDSFGEVSTELETEGGDGEIEQTLFFSAERAAGFSGYASLSHSVSGTGVLSMNSNMVCSGQSSTAPSLDQSHVESQSYGLTMVVPGTDDYSLSLSGGYETRTNGALAPVPEWMTEEPKEFSVSLEHCSLDLEYPADFLSQDVDLEFIVRGNDVAVYDYDLERTLEIGDAACKVDMELMHVERD